MLPLLDFMGSVPLLPGFLNSVVAVADMPPLILAVGVPLLFVIAYVLVMFEETLHMRKSKPVMLAAGLIWLLIAIFPPLADHDAADHPTPASGEASRIPYGQVKGLPQAEELLHAREHVGDALRHYLLEYAELFLFLLAAMTYVNAMEERKIFDVLRDKLIRSGLGYRGLFWATGAIAFFLSPVLDNMTTALVVCSALVALGRDSPRFVTLGAINLVVAANAGGAFSPFGDITTLLVWQAGHLPFTDFFALFVPSVVNAVVPAACMHFAVPKGRPSSPEVESHFRRGALGVMVLFAATIGTTVMMHSFLHLPPVLGMMTGLAYLKLYSYYLTITSPNGEQSNPDIVGRDAEDVSPFDSFKLVARAEWDTLLFFYGVTLCVGGLGYIGYLTLGADYFYGTWGHTQANIAIGILSAVVDNIPVMMAVLEMNPAGMTEGQWLLVTLTAGVGGSLLSIGSAAGVALMGQARGIYTFGTHLAWTPAIFLGYVASIAVHFWWNSHLFTTVYHP